MPWTSLTRSSSARFAAAFRWCAAHRHEACAVAALLACFAVVLDLCSFSKAPGESPQAGDQQTLLLARAYIEPGERLDRFPRTTETVEVLAQANPLPDLPSLPADAFARAVFLPVPPKMAEAEVQPASAPDAPELAPLAAIAGVWVPEAGACSARSFRDGLLPTIINTEGAWAGETFCLFKNTRQTDTGWRVTASCSNAREHWTTDVRLSVSDNRLTWSSKRGTQTYARCASDFMMASR